MVGENWELAENLALHGHNSHSRMIHFDVDEIVPYPAYLFDLNSIASYHQSPKHRKTMFTPTRGTFFDFQIPVMEAINNVGAHLESIPSY